jgi:twitching motility two-component system response regulator PilH
MAKKILLVDDDEGFLLAAGQLLEAAGYEVTRTCGADEARAELDKALPDLILLDVIMPGKDGFAFSDELSKEERLKGVPVVLVTAVAENTGQMMRAFEEDKGLAAANILPKSAAHTDLVNTVAAALAS